MTVRSVFEGSGDPEEILDRAERHMDGAQADFDAMIQYLRDRDDLSEAEIKRVVTAYRRAVQTLYDERKRVGELRRKGAGIVGDYAVDFDAARSEIGRRLDRLRAAERAG